MADSDIKEVEIFAGAKAIGERYGSFINREQALALAYAVLIAARKALGNPSEFATEFVEDKLQRDGSGPNGCL